MPSLVATTSALARITFSARTLFAPIHFWALEILVIVIVHSIPLYFAVSKYVSI